MSNSSLKIIIGVLVVSLTASISVAAFYIHKNKTANIPTGPTVEGVPANQSENLSEKITSYEVVTKENPSDKTKTDVYLKDPKTEQETFYLTLSDVLRNYYRNAEYHNGNLYILQRTGGEYGYKTNPDWTDELWRYNEQKQGQKLYSSQGLSFSVSDNEKIIAVVTEKELNLLNNGGEKIKTFPGSDVIAGKDEALFNFLAWGPNSIWLQSSGMATLAGLTKIDTQTYSVTKYDLSELPYNVSVGPEFTINSSKEKAAFSDYPALVDTESAQEYEQSGKKVSLVVYDLKTKTQQQIAASTTKKFEPKWINENTLEYDDPNGAGRLTTQIP